MTVQVMYDEPSEKFVDKPKNNIIDLFELEEDPQKWTDDRGKVHEALTQQVYAIYDAAADVYRAPMLFVNDQVAIRTFKALVVPGTDLYQFAEDYWLVYLGDFDQHYGYFYRSVQLPVVCDAKEVKEEYDKIQESLREKESGEEEE